MKMKTYHVSIQVIKTYIVPVKAESELAAIDKVQGMRSTDVDLLGELQDIVMDRVSEPIMQRS